MKLGALLLASISAAVVLLRADTIELKTGERVDGIFKGATASAVSIEVAGQPMNIELRKVRAIFIGSAPDLAAPSLGGARSPESEVIEMLAALRSVVRTGLTYAQYSQRVLDTKVVFDRYIASSSFGEQQDHIAKTMGYYEEASQAWGAAITRSAESYLTAQRIGNALMRDECPEAKQLAASAANKKTGAVDPALVGVLAGRAPRVFWACAERTSALIDSEAK